MTNKAINNSPEYILYNGNFITMDDRQEKCSAVAIKDGKITHMYCGDNRKIKRGFQTRLIDLEGKTVLPGLIDCNVHLIQGGLQKYCIEVYADTKKEFLEKLSDKITRFKNNEWVWCVGYNDTLEELTRWDLDKVSVTHPIVISKTEFHITIANTFAYRMLQIPISVSGTKRDNDGVPTGVLGGEASGFARRKLFVSLVNDSLRDRILQEMDHELLANGITTVNAMEGGPFFADRDIYVANKYAEKSTVDILLFPQTMDINVAIDSHLPRIGGNIYLDGSIRSKTAAIIDNYQNENQNGILYYSQDDVNAFILDAHSHELQIAISCIGTRAIQQALDAFENAFQIVGKNNHRHRLELFVLPTEVQIKKAVELGLILSMRPNYDKLYALKGGAYEKSIGDRREQCNPLSSIVKAGGIVCCGSEHSVTPLNPFMSIEACVLHNQEKERLSVYEALKGYTVNAAYANYAEDRIGRIRAGYDADLIVISEDPFKVQTEDIGKIKILMTMKRGKIVYHERGIL